MHGEMAECMVRWQNAWRDGRMHGEMAECMVRWQNAWWDVRMLGEMAEGACRPKLDDKT
jgi:hypothetical protein